MGAISLKPTTVRLRSTTYLLIGNRAHRTGLHLTEPGFFYVCSNHPFVDGNKRTALAACLVFLRENGFLDDPKLPSRDVDARETFVLEVAASRLDRDATTKRLRKLLE